MDKETPSQPLQYNTQQRCVHNLVKHLKWDAFQKKLMAYRQEEENS